MLRLGLTPGGFGRPIYLAPGVARLRRQSDGGQGEFDNNLGRKLPGVGLVVVAGEHRHDQLVLNNKLGIWIYLHIENHPEIMFLCT